MSHRSSPHRPRCEPISCLVEAPPVPLHRLADRVPQLPAPQSEEPLQVRKQGFHGCCQCLAFAVVRSSHPSCEKLRVHCGLQSSSLAGPSPRFQLPRLLLLLHLLQPLPSLALLRLTPRLPRCLALPVPRQPRWQVEQLASLVDEIVL
eukprot:2675994-Heterocapsa_arctica.AAC.1